LPCKKALFPYSEATINILLVKSLRANDSKITIPKAAVVAKYGIAAAIGVSSNAS
jgi:hypothetical protein